MNSFLIHTAILGLLCLSSPSIADEVSSSSGASHVQTVNEHLAPHQIDAKREDVGAELRIALLQEAVENTEANEADKPREQAADESVVDLLKQIDVTIAQQKTATASLQDARSKQDELKTEIQRLENTGVEGGPPYSINILDQYTDAVASGKATRESMDASVLAARDAVEVSHDQVEARKRAVRQWKESGGIEGDAQGRRLQLDSQLADEMLVLNRQQLSINEANAEIAQQEEILDKRRLALVSASVVFSKETLNEKLAELDARESELKRRSSVIQSELQYAERRWLDARQEMDAVASPTDDAVQRVEALKTAQQTVQIEQSIVNQRLQRIPMLQTSWQRRYLVATDKSTRQEERIWLDETEEQIQQIAREKQSKLLKLLETREVQAAIATKVDALSSEQESLRRWLNANFQSLSKQVEIYNSAMLDLDSASRGLSRLKVDIEGTPSRSLGEWFADCWSSLHRYWNYELTSIDDTSITVGKIASSILFLLFGYIAAKIISSVLGNRLPKLGVDEAGAHAIESLAFYALLIVFGLGVLRYANVPLTVFTFLGGTIAIGVGFGSQNILNNFISGLILLAERPIRAGDLIMLDDTYGNVKTIGARSTTIRTGENLDIIVPNSKFLENNVVNLTRRDDRLRTSINVGVAYGSDLNKVLTLLEQAASENEHVNDRPKPFVWFNDFGDNALAFQVHFWINARTIVQMRKTETEVRLAIDRLFREYGISIAFPQRDIHLQTERPINVRMVDDQFSADAA